MPVYRSFTQAELDIQYTARTGAPDWEDYIREGSASSARVRAAFGHIPNLRYGAHRDEVLDVFPTTRGAAPIMLFIHGGYWRMLSKDDVSCFAAVFVPAGAVYVAINYSLAPAASIDRIVGQCRAALAWVWRNAAMIGGDPDRLHVSGRSAGGHLVGMMLATDWAGDYGLPADVIKGACAISGLYDLEPVRLSSVNEWAKLDPESARRNSPQHHLPEKGCPLIVAWGTNETAEFQRQSTDYAAAWASRGFPCTVIPMPGCHHFAVMEQMMTTGNPLTRAVLDQMGLSA